jgi:hypothetical protein
MKVVFLLAAALAFAVHAGEAHVHGEGRLDVTIDKETVTLTLELPMDAAVGFEREPKSDKEKAALAAAEKTLNDTAALFLPTPAAGCTVQSAKVAIPRFSDTPEIKKDAHGHEKRTDIDSTYTFHCANAPALKSIETTLFKGFKRLYRLETRRVGPAGQSAKRLTPKNPVLSW